MAQNGNQSSANQTAQPAEKKDASASQKTAQTPTQGPIEIEPLTPEEEKEREKDGNEVRIEDDPDYPREWIPKDIPTLVAKKFRYYHKNTKEGKTYMILRHGRKERSLGQLTEEREIKLFKFFPDLEAAAPVLPTTAQTAKVHTVPQGRGYLSVPIHRVGMIPRDYVPTIDVVRYFQILVNNGFKGDFSKFINDIVIEHFVKCNGVILPILLREEVEQA